MRFVQLRTAAGDRRVAISDPAPVRLVRGVATMKELAERALADGLALAAEAAKLGTDLTEDLDRALAEGRVLPPLDHPEPARCHVTGTGLTHLASAQARQSMHEGAAAAAETDSMRMFKMGLDGGKPAGDAVGVQPEWFYKGNGHALAAPGAPLRRPGFAQDGGEEPEVAGLYLIAPDGTPCRLGFALGNEFSDHVMERVNYLWLAPSKIRDSAVGPELLTGALPAAVEGSVRVRRGAAVVWEKPFLTGEAHMTHWIRNLEAHHFKYPLFRVPGDVHVHFFGTGTFSFKDGVQVADGDVLEVEAGSFGRPLRNPVRFTGEGYPAVRTL